jgi:hypothetical protein
MNDTAAVVRPPTPFKELDFFVEADAAMFAGREREARQLVSRIVSSRAVVVHARSGLGKTSLPRAGVVPPLRQQSFRPVYARTLDSLLGDLGEAVAQDCGISPSATDGDPEERTRRVIEAAAAGGPLVLMLDQFEEFFTRFERQPRERQAFVQFTRKCAPWRFENQHLETLRDKAEELYVAAARAYAELASTERRMSLVHRHRTLPEDLRGTLPFARQLVASGAEVNKRLAKGKGKYLNMQGATPFLLAAQTADLPYMRPRIELGADPPLPDDVRAS